MTPFIEVNTLTNNDQHFSKTYVNPEKIKAIDLYDTYAIIVLGYCQTIKVSIEDAMMVLRHTGRIGIKRPNSTPTPSKGIVL